MNHPAPPTMPNRLHRLPRTAAGIPIPYFVAKVEGRYDFRVMDVEKLPKAIRHRLCWLCGQPMGRMMCFVVGPMCVVNRVSAEPPMHRDCAEYALQACPFLTQPGRVRREAGLPEDRVMHGIPILRNPGVSALYVTRSYQTFKPPGGGVLFDMGRPEEVAWWAQGRAATRAEVETSIASGLPALEEAAAQDRRPDDARAALIGQVAQAMVLLPAGDAP